MVEGDVAPLGLQFSSPMRQFKKITATHLYCNNCAQSMPVRERLLLVLPDGNLFDYACAQCGQSLGTRMETKGLSNEGEEN